jgi:F0F1-type ATP synthase membrane subunit b/b'
MEEKMKSKKSLLTVVVVTICLFGVVALASPTTYFFNNVISSVKSAFSAETNTEIKSATKSNTDVATYLQPTPETLNQLDEAVPEQVLWRAIFSIPSKLEKGAEDARQDGMNDSLWTEFFTRQVKLSETDTQIFKDIAKQHQQEIQTLNQRMQNLAQETRQMRKQILQEKDESKRNEFIELQVKKKKEVVEIQKQKDQATLNYRDKFKEAVSEETFSAFEKWLQQDFSKGFLRKKITSNDKPNKLFPNGQPSNNGFKSFEDNEEEKQK